MSGTKDPYSVIKNIYITEKSKVLQELKENTSNPSVRKCKSPKYVFEVNSFANKREIAEAIEEIYRDKDVKVMAVNTINVKGKPRRVRGRLGRTSSFKKAIVTLAEKDSLE